MEHTLKMDFKVCSVLVGSEWISSGSIMRQDLF